MQEQKQATQFVSALREIIDQQFAGRDCSVPFQVESVNTNGTINAYILPDKTTIAKNLFNQTRYDFKAGDVGILYMIGGRLSNSFIMGKYNPKPEDVAWSNLTVQSISGVPEASYPVPSGKMIDHIELVGDIGGDRVYRIYYTDGTYDELRVPLGAVQSVNGKTGNVVLHLNDVDYPTEETIWDNGDSSEMTWNSGNLSSDKSNFNGVVFSSPSLMKAVTSTRSAAIEEKNQIQQAATPRYEAWVSEQLFKYAPVRLLENFAIYFDDKPYDTQNIFDIMGKYEEASTISIVGTINGKIIHLYFSDGDFISSASYERGPAKILTENIHLNYIN